MNTTFHHMKPDPPIKPFQPNIVALEPASQTFSYHSHIVDHDAPKEIKAIFDAYRAWTWL